MGISLPLPLSIIVGSHMAFYSHLVSEPSVSTGGKKGALCVVLMENFGYYYFRVTYLHGRTLG